MRNMLALVGLAVVAFCGLGWYLNWYKLAVQPGADGKQHISVDVDTKKIAADAKTAINDLVDTKIEKADAKTTGDKLIDDFVGPPAPAKDAAPTTGGTTIQLPTIKIGGRQERD